MKQPWHPVTNRCALAACGRAVPARGTPCPCAAPGAPLMAAPLPPCQPSCRLCQRTYNGAEAQAAHHGFRIELGSLLGGAGGAPRLWGREPRDRLPLVVLVCTRLPAGPHSAPPWPQPAPAPCCLPATCRLPASAPARARTDACPAQARHTPRAQPSAPTCLARRIKHGLPCREGEVHCQQGVVQVGFVSV